MLELIRIKRTDARLLVNMANHYSKPKGFVGRNICYAIMHNNTYYGAICGGSSTLHLPGRDVFFGLSKENKQEMLLHIVNNIFYHIEPIEGKYPIRNFSIAVLNLFCKQIAVDWELKYGNKVIGFESLVELPRTGEIYKRANWVETGITKGYTCKRTAGIGSDGWTGKRVWDHTQLRPKRVFCKKA